MGGLRGIDRPLRETEAVIGAREFLDQAFRSRHLKGITQSRDHMVWHMLIALGEAVIELTLNLIEQKVRRVLLVSDDANAVKRGL